jgi:UDP-glucuronate 4-epimerase
MRNNEPSMKVVLITGALGFVGINMVRHLARANRVVALARRAPDADAHRFLDEVSSSILWVQGDVTDRRGMLELVRQHRVSHVLHAAAVTATAQQERDNPASTFDVNAGGTLNVLEAGRLAEVERIVYVSSGGLYGAAPPTPTKRETDPLELKNLYAVSKQTSEQLCRRYDELFAPSVIVGRLGTAYGPMERPTGSRDKMSAVYQVVHAALAKQPIAVAGADIARDFCHIDDVCAAYTELLFGRTQHHAVYNVGSPTAFPLRDALTALSEEVPGFAWHETADLAAADVVQTPANARAGMDLSRLQSDTGWKPRYDLKSGVSAYLHWLRQR